jgi:glutamate-ammonia-ligase adenylyltransferase
MRQKMRSEISRSGDGQFDIKQDTGGVADIEFLVQFLVLKEARRYPGLLTYSDNMRQLEALAECGVLDAEQTRLLMEAYVAYRQRLHHLSLEFSGSTVDDDEFFEESSAVKTLWTELIRD